MQAVERASSNLSTRRARDYVGQMLWHHTARSTEYFSRWVEIKEAAATAAMGAEKAAGDIIKETAAAVLTAATSVEV